MKNPIVLWPKTTPEEVFKDCEKWVEDHGGLSHSDGSPNLMAAAGADPGCCKCPSCKEFHWSLGIIHQCPTCGFIYPSDWWPMYSFGCAAGRRKGKTAETPYEKILEKSDLRRRGHPYYDYGYNNPSFYPCDTRNEIDWKQAVGLCYIAGGELGEVRNYLQVITGINIHRSNDKSPKMACYDDSINASEFKEK